MTEPADTIDSIYRGFPRRTDLSDAELAGIIKGATRYLVRVKHSAVRLMDAPEVTEAREPAEAAVAAIVRLKPIMIKLVALLDQAAENQLLTKLLDDAGLINADAESTPEDASDLAARLRTVARFSRQPNAPEKFYARAVGRRIIADYEAITGKRPTTTTVDGKKHGAIIDALSAVFAALGIKGSAVSVANNLLYRHKQKSRPE